MIPPLFSTKKFKVIPVLFLFAIFSCSKNDDSEKKGEEFADDQCGVPVFIRHSSTKTYKLFHEYTGKLIRVDAGHITDTNEFSDEFGGIDFGLSYKADTIFVNDLPSNSKLMTIVFKNNKVSELRRVYITGNTNIWTFEYMPKNIRVNFDYYNGQITYPIGFADYQLDNQENVISVSKHEYDRNNPTQVNLIESQVLTHDDSKNPWRGFHMPFFIQTSYPDSQYFSKSNILTIEKTKPAKNNAEDYVSLESYEYTYNDQGLPVKRTSSDDEIQYYSYEGCPLWPWDE